MLIIDLGSMGIVSSAQRTEVAASRVASKRFNHLSDDSWESREKWK